MRLYTEQIEEITLNKREIAAIYIGFPLICLGLIISASPFDLNPGWNLAIIWFFIISGIIGLIYGAIGSIRKQTSHVLKNFWIGALTGSVVIVVTGLIVTIISIMAVINNSGNSVSAINPLTSISDWKNWIFLFGIPIYNVSIALFIGLPVSGVGGLSLGKIWDRSTAALIGGLVTGISISICFLFLYIIAAIIGSPQ